MGWPDVSAIGGPFDRHTHFEQLYVHIIAISKGVVSKKYNIKKPHKVIVVCEYESVKKSVIQRLQKERGIEQYNNFFFFKTNAELEDNFYDNWTLLNGKRVGFLKKSEPVRLAASS